MPHSLQVNRELGITEIEAHGDLTEEEVRQVFADAFQIARTEGVHRILADISSVDQMPGIVATVGIFSECPVSVRQAIFTGNSPSENAKDEASFIEDMCVRRGRPTKVFSDMDEALDWLADSGIGEHDSQRAAAGRTR